MLAGVAAEEVVVEDLEVAAEPARTQLASAKVWAVEVPAVSGQLPKRQQQQTTMRRWLLRQDRLKNTIKINHFVINKVGKLLFSSKKAFG